MLVSSKTSHKWEPVLSEIGLVIAQWEYIAQSPYAQYFAVRVLRSICPYSTDIAWQIGDSDHYILSGQSPKARTQSFP